MPSPGSNNSGLVMVILFLLACCCCSAGGGILYKVLYTSNDTTSNATTSDAAVVSMNASNTVVMTASNAVPVVVATPLVVTSAACVQTSCNTMRGDGNYSVLSGTAASLWTDSQRSTAMLLILNATGLTFAGLQGLTNTDLHDILVSASPTTTAASHGLNVTVPPSSITQPATNGAGVSLTAPSTLTSNNKMYQMMLQSDGNLCVYPTGKAAIWSTNTNTVSDAYVLVLMYSGYLGLVTAADKAAPSNTRYQNKSGSVTYWTNGLPTNTAPLAGQGPYSLVMQDSGALQTVSATGTVVWSSV